MSKYNCQKELWNGCCCCNCANHLEDFYHCVTQPKPEGVKGCVCSTHKGWIWLQSCIVSNEAQRSDYCRSGGLIAQMFHFKNKVYEKHRRSKYHYTSHCRQ